MFNLKKKAQINNVDTRLKQDRIDFDTSADDDTGNLDWLLRPGRKNNTGDSITEKQLDPSREKTSNSILEKQLNANPDGLYNKNRDNIKTPLMDMAMESERQFIEAYNKAEDPASKDASDQFPVKPGSQMIGKPTKIKGTEQRSQLLSNYETREDMNDANPSIKKASGILSLIKDADAMIYHLHRKSASENREMTKKEHNTLNHINAEKVKLITKLSQSQMDNAVDNDYRSDVSDMAGDLAAEKMEVGDNLDEPIAGDLVEVVQTFHHRDGHVDDERSQWKISSFSVDHSSGGFSLELGSNSGVDSMNVNLPNDVTKLNGTNGKWTIYIESTEQENGDFMITKIS